LPATSRPVNTISFSAAHCGELKTPEANPELEPRTPGTLNPC
jgi:hypothetical protein